MSTDGMKFDMPMFGGKNRLSHNLYLLMFEGELRKYCGFSCAIVFPFKQPCSF
jgi:hypothetical protein